MAKIAVLNDGDKVSLDLPKELNIGDTVSLLSETGNIQVKIEANLINQDKLYRSYEWLQENYVNKGMTMAEIGRMFNVSPMTVCTWLEKYDIETRSVSRRS